MKKAVLFFLCLMLTGCAPAQPGGSLGEESSSAQQQSSQSGSSQEEGGQGSSSQFQPDQSQPQEGQEGETTPTEQTVLPQNRDQIIEELLSAMTVEEKVGQMFLARCPQENAAQAVSDYKLGGYVLFGRDFKGKTAQQVRDDTASYQAASGVPMLIATDEEGGTVVRASSNPNLFAEPCQSPQELYQEGGMERVLRDTRQKDLTLLDLGVNVNLAPVADVSTDENDFIYDRSLGQDAETTAQYVGQVVETMQEDRIGSVLKHFPGYGSSQDTHVGVAMDQRPYETFTSSDFLPFEAGIQAGAGGVLVGHVVVTSMDETMPASLSQPVHTILREELGFEGVIMTDDLAMEAITHYVQDQSPAVMAVLAGNDMVLTTDFETQIPEVIQAVEDGTIPMEQVDQSVSRILSWKYDLGLLGN